MNIGKIFFIGLGGAGQRHLRVFRSLLPPDTEFSAYRSTRKTPLLNPDFSVDETSSIEKRYNLKLFETVEEGFGNRPDLVVISTPTSLHFDTAFKAAMSDLNLFVEKPFSDNLSGFQEFQELVMSKELYFFVSFQRRFHPYLLKIKRIVSSGQLGKVISAVFNVCSYVPAWHRYEDFRDLYACRKQLGGGVLLTEIHELDLCYWYFGLPKRVYCTGGNYSDIKLDVEDTAHVALGYEDFSVQVNLCFVQRHKRRDLYIAGTRGYLEWTETNNSLVVHEYDKEREEGYCDPKYDNSEMFVAQATHFLSQFGVRDSKTYLDVARSSLAIVEAAKESMQRGHEINLSS